MTSSGASLDEAFVRLADGDRAAFNEVFVALWPRIHAFCRRMLGDGPDAEDAAQNALTTLFARSATFDRERSALGWALAIATWECRSFRRRDSRSRVVEVAMPEVATASDSPEAVAAHRQLVAAAELAIEELSEGDRAIVRETLFDMVEKDGPADAAARKRRQRAFDRLRAAWRRLHGDANA
jgi:RNA polymerase sigma-70 factor (ECF subfamily)